MQHRLARRKIAARQRQLPHLLARFREHAHDRTDAEFVRGRAQRRARGLERSRKAAQRDHHAVAGVAVVAQHRRARLVIGVHEVEVAIPVEVAEGRAETHARLVEAPRRTDSLEAQVAEVAVGKMPLGEDRARFHQPHALRRRLRLHHGLQQVQVVLLAVHAIGHVHIEPAVVVEILEAHRPGPVGGREAGKRRGLEEVAGAGIKIERVARHLRCGRGVGARGIPGLGARVRHAALVLLRRGRRHVRHEQVDPPVVVHVAEVGAHGRVRRARHDAAGDLGEGAVAVVVVEEVRDGKIVRDVDVGPAVVVVVPPRRGMPLRFAGDAGGGGDIRERAVAVVVEKIIRLAVGVRGCIEQVGVDVHVEPAVAVIIGEGRHAAGVLERESARRRLLLEGAVALVDEKLVGRAQAADIEVEPAVVVHVGKRRTLLPLARGIADVGAFGHVLELPAALIMEQAAGLHLAHDKNVRPAVIVVVADRHARADFADAGLVEALVPHARVGVIVGRHDARDGGRQIREQGRPARRGTRLERRARESGRIGRLQPQPAQQCHEERGGSAPTPGPSVGSEMPGVRKPHRRISLSTS